MEPPLLKFLLILGAKLPQSSYNDLAFPIPLPGIQHFVLYCYDEVHHWYMTIKIFLDVGYVMSQLD